ncbi:MULTISPECIES: diguanylate cyclase [unclassified Cobetia]|uniref:bifunctional diguanylate cyclase/phosphodiesterase n=1 Tax=unclassified Cobetia TaxID=2609414 RepID=UPI00178C8E91|nr:MULTISPECIES: diguanylate cyclase [unclassified Cobetia]MBE2168078.1 diguanylate cyclase [Cobetia sp. 2AS1]MDH2446501.1 diguanylate cyclase [Cobetia sp. 2AS]
MQRFEMIQTLLGQMLGQIDDIILLADDQRHITYLNDSAVKAFGYPREALIGKQTRMLYASSDEFERQGQRRFRVDAQPAKEGRVIRYRRQDGTYFYGETLGGPIKDPTSDNIFMFGLIRDVSRRVTAEHTLHSLHAITSSRELNFNERIDELLKLGCAHFGLPIGIFSRIQGGEYVVQRACHPEDLLEPGLSFSLSDTYCDHVYKADCVQAFHHVASSEIRNHPCYANFNLEAYIGAPVIVDGERYGTFNFSSPDPVPPFTAQDIELVRLIALWAGHEVARANDINALKEAHQALEKIAITDPLTGLYNRRHAQQVLDDSIAALATAEVDHPLCVALLDFDHFKKINDNHGHDAGDLALQHLSVLAEEILLPGDTLARWGGEEFLAILPDSLLSDSATRINLLRQRMKDSVVEYAGQRLPLSLSIGMTCLAPDDSATREQLIARADEAMYAAKEEGRNCLRML